MSYSENFPSIRPSFQFSADAGRLDPRISYSRSTTGTYFGTDKHLSSENLNPNSEALTGTGYTAVNVTATTGQADPTGGTSAVRFEQDSGQTTSGYLWVENQPSSGQFTYSFHAKANGKNYIVIQEVYTDSSLNETWFSISGAGGAGTTNANHSNVTVTKLGDWYRCSWTMTSTRVGYLRIGVADSDGSTTVTDSGGVYLYGLQRNTGSSLLDYQSTSGQIHREYAPTLQTAAINAPRFEFSATDSASMGLLIEGQATNINTYSKGGVNGSGVVQWQVDNGSATGNSAVGPDGTLSALHFVPNTVPTAHYVYNNVGSVPSGSTPYTISVYAKAAGESDIVIRLTSSYSAFANTINATFTLTGDGSVSVTGGTATAAIESCGNGWYRCQVTETTDSSPTGMRPYIYARQVASYAGDGFSGVLLWGWQVEANSFASSFVDTGTSGGTATRAADSAAMVSSSLFDTGSGAIICELGPVAGTVYPTAFALTDSSTQNIVRCQGNNGATQMSLVVNADNSGVATITQSFTSTGTKLGVSYDTNSFRFCTDGGTVDSDTAGQVPEGLNRLEIGGDTYSSSSLNGNVKRIAVYSALTDTNLQALTS